MTRYNPKDIESKWQKIWDDTKLYEVDEDSDKKKIYATPMLPYPSGSGLHVGHGRNYSITDAIARFYRQRGYNVMSNMGWDAFGLPTENYAIKAGITPQEATKQNIEHFKDQLKRFGMSYDWSREINTTDSEYYKWTQWIFTKLFEDDLAYQGVSQQWWCDQCKTVLANEQVIDGKCWRHDGPDDNPVTRRETKQWFFKITEYADELLEHTDELDWPESIKSMQKNWIGRSKGAEIDFAIKDTEEKLTVFTTRPDTLFGATYMVLAPEHGLVSEITSASQKQQVETYLKQATGKSDLERKQSEKDKTGIFTGAYAINPVNDEEIPIWIADYVLMGYGTGAIMAVPAHDERDFEFATKFDLPVRQVVAWSEVDQDNPPQKGYKEVTRDTVIVHVRDKKRGKYALLNWHGSLEGITTAIMGGVEEGQTVEEAALTEIKEEAGLDAKIVKICPEISISKYCASHKQENRHAVATGVLAEVSDASKAKEVSEDEKAKHTLLWVDESEIESNLTPVHQKFVWQQVNNFTPYTGEGELINSDAYNNQSSAEVRDRIVADLAKKEKAKETTNYKMRDWLISRQRYWGAPIPIIHCDDCGPVAVAEADLPVVLPEAENFKPTGGSTSVLAEIDDWVNVDCPKCDKPAKRETDTMDGYACSSWYMYRYTDAQNSEKAWSPENANYWMPVDFYCGGDHAVSHLLYFRFWNKYFRDKGWVDFDEPVKKLVFNGYINAEDGTKMSKSKGNVVDPLEVIDSGYGADALRLYELFIAPYDQDTAWSNQGVPGTYRYLNRVWDFVQDFMQAEPIDHDEDTSELETAVMGSVHRAIKKVTEDMEDLSFNTAIAAQMKLSNELREHVKELPFGKAPQTWMVAVETSLRLLAPFAPHMTEELWHQFEHNDASIHVDGWPVWDEELVKEELVTIVVQINGKVRAQLELPADVSDEDMVSAAQKEEKIAEYLKDGEVKKTITVSGKLVNFVV